MSSRIAHYSLTPERLPWVTIHLPRVLSLPMIDQPRWGGKGERAFSESDPLDRVTSSGDAVA